ncbi:MULTISPECIES: YxeA family protein [Enterococcus]|uniref:YxeA family protein n=1 Tax=Enterococcus TaxID=1350 RepID=UPI00065E7360|nr:MULTISPECIES: YxeA family protein [Enterococcus]KAF1302979.1 hypothetical protein BAU16_05750 [Enterococcus sp. JM9B]
MRKTIGGLVLILVLGVGAYFGYNYYKETYQGIPAYAKVPATTPEKVQTKSDSGEIIKGWSSYKYTFTFVKENGEHQEMTYELSGENPTPFQPNTIVKASISKKRVIKGPNVVEKSSVPEKVLKELGE